MTYQREIQQLYVAYFNRPADTKGLSYWEGQLLTGKASMATISAAFAASPEYRGAFANMHATVIVEQIYLNLFGRVPDLAGRSYWAELLRLGQLSVDRIVKNIADGAQGSDKTAFANKVQGAIAFTAALDTPAEASGYSGAAANKVAAQFISTITTDASLAQAVWPASLSDTVLAVLQALPVIPQFLTAGIDALTGSAGMDSFNAPVNTLQSGDRIDGLGGVDRLHADLSSQKSAVAPELVNMESVIIRAVANATAPATGDAAHPVRIDAERTFGVTHWESNNSQADVIIEDVRIRNNQVTADITIAMVETDAGKVDFGVYFDPYSLRSLVATTDVLRLELMDTDSAGAGLAPLLGNPYTGVAFFYNDKLVEVESKAIGDAQTYDQLLTAFQHAVAAMPGLAYVSVSKGPEFTVISSITGKPLTGTEILLTAKNGNVIAATGLGVRWLDPSIVGVPEGPHSRISTLPFTTPGPISSTIILDDVGRGGTSGDLVVGADYYGGIERFNIEVRDNSKLQTINSTDKRLKEVFIENGWTTSHQVLDVSNKGDLTVFGTVVPVLDGSAVQHNTYGFSDVRVIDASTMGGRLIFSAEITAAALQKYQGSPFRGILWQKQFEYVYNGGTNNDSMTVTIDSVALAVDPDDAYSGPSRFVARGNGGDDRIVITMTGGTVAGAGNRVTVDGGSGDDWLHVEVTSSAVLLLGAGDDTVYALGGSHNQIGGFDNHVTGGLGNDQIVLGGTSATSLIAASDWLYYDDQPFGNDTVINFALSGADVFDMRALGGRGSAFAGTAIANTDWAITIQRSDAGNDTVAEIVALYADGVAASAHLFIAYDADSVGKVYTVADGAGVSTGNVVVTLVGTIDLENTAWGSLTAANFA